MRLQSTRRHLSGDLVRNRIGGLTPPGGRHQRHLVVYTQNSSGIKCMPLSGKKGKGKVFPYSLPSVGPGADPGVQAVSPQVT